MGVAFSWSEGLEETKHKKCFRLFSSIFFFQIFVMAADFCGDGILDE